MTVRILTGDCREVLATMPEESVHMVCTSPPYWGLRDYKVPPSVWGGDADCAHQFGELGPAHHPGQVPDGKAVHDENAIGQRAGSSRFCSLCTAWYGALGLEPTPELHVEHIVEIFREVRRVLRKDGTLWLNYGDCYAGSPNGRSAAAVKALGNDDRTFRDKPFGTAVGGLKPKDLVMMPARVALALQADGWWLRSQMPWVKRNGMPESVTDRPATAVEYLFLLAKSRRYFYDAQAVWRPYQESSIARVSQNDGNPKWNGNRQRGSTQNPQTLDITKMVRGGPRKKGKRGPSGWASSPHYAGQDPRYRKRAEPPRHSQYDTGHQGLDDAPRDEGRTWRNCDLFYDSLEAPFGLISGADGEPLALDVCPHPYPDAHFATFPPALVVPCIKAGTSEEGCCSKCGAPWVREIEEIDRGGKRIRDELEMGATRNAMGGQKEWDQYEAAKTTGWSPSCECVYEDGFPLEPVPAVALDPFGGSGTVGLVADRLSRDAILIELNPEYADMARARITEDAPLFADLSSEAPAKAEVG